VAVQNGRIAVLRAKPLKPAEAAAWVEDFLDDAPDLGFRNRRFQNIAFRFEKESFYERKTAISGEMTHFANGE
jgi:hypothetical protein